MDNKTSKKEKSLYKPILDWLDEYLKNKNPRAKVSVYDVHSTDLSDFLQRTPFKKYFPEYSTYKIRVDLVGVVEQKDKCFLTFIEVKYGQLNLRDVSQLLGYSRIVKPEASFLISHKGPTRPLGQLLKYFGRLDILEYKPNYFIRIARWDSSRKAILMDSVIPPLNQL